MLCSLTGQHSTAEVDVCAITCMLLMAIIRFGPAAGVMLFWVLTPRLDQVTLINCKQMNSYHLLPIAIGFELAAQLTSLWPWQQQQLEILNSKQQCFGVPCASVGTVLPPGAGSCTSTCLCA
jgi:hypothetical protein